MSQSEISALFLDIGGVLLTNGWDRNSRRLAAETFSLDYEEMDERHHLTFDTYEEGKQSLDDYLSRVIFYEERPFSRARFREFMYSQSRPHPDMINLVRDLKSRYRLKVATINNEGRELSLFRIRRFDLASFIDFFVSSCFVHFRKPDPDIYRLALDISQVEPEQAVYLEDRSMFVEVARSLGMRGIVHSGYQSTRAALQALGLQIA